MRRMQQSDCEVTWGPPLHPAVQATTRARGPLRAVPDTSHRSSHLPMPSRALAPTKDERVGTLYPSVESLSGVTRAIAGVLFLESSASACTARLVNPEIPPWLQRKKKVTQKNDRHAARGDWTKIEGPDD